MTALKQLRAILLLPGLVTVAIPALLEGIFGRSRPAPARPKPWRWLPLMGGAALIGSGLGLLGNTMRLLARQGEGTLAPWDPTRRLVVEGVYQHVRNPMLSGVFLILLGEAIWRRSPRLLGWFAFFVAGNLLYVPHVEEPSLERRFGADYRQYKEQVPRWIPRAVPWQP
jgi:protein-S-isoprenylcysteine O-methyltransferase Ste14